MSQIAFLSFAAAEISADLTANNKHKIWIGGNFTMLTPEQLTLFQKDGGGMFMLSSEKRMVPTSKTDKTLVEKTVNSATYTGRPSLALVAQNKILDIELSLEQAMSLCGL